MVETFDKIMVLSSNGECLYFGPTDRELLRETFLGDDNGSVADLVLDASLDKTGKAEEDIRSRYLSSKTYQSVADEISKLRSRPREGRRGSASLL